MKNKRGDIPVTILVIGILVVCILSIASFILSDKLFVRDNLKIENFEKIHSDVERFEFYRLIGDSDEEAALKIGATIQGSYLVLTEKSKDILIEYKYLIN